MSASIAYRARSELLKADLQGASDVGLDGKDDRIYKQLLNEDREFEEIETPYGKLIKTEVLSTGFMLKYLCPFSWLYYVCMISSDFFNLMEKSLRDDVSPPTARIALYLDEVVPGNALRPDKGRAYLAVYWTFIDFPSWFRSSQNGWFNLCFVPHNAITDLPGEHSELVTTLLKLFWSPSPNDFNFARSGIRLKSNLDEATPALGEARPAQGIASPAAALPSCSPAPPSAGKTRKRLDRYFFFLAIFACFLGDEKAFGELSMAKGASGRKPCICCQNVLGRFPFDQVPADSPLVHFTCGDPARFVPNTPLGLRELYAYLKAQSTLRGVGDYNSLETEAGFTYSDDCLLASEMAKVANLPYSVYWDWMHCMVASGGTAQYEVNQVLIRISAFCPIEKVDEFRTMVTLAKSTPLDCLFTDRMRGGTGDHIKAFASEVLSMVIVVGLFLEMIFVPKGLLVQETECFVLLGRICFLLRSGDEARERLGLLNSLILEHHRLFVFLYPDASKPKVHFLLHIPECILRFGALLSCFVTERKHKESKIIGTFAFKMWTDTMLRRNLRTQLQKFAQSDFLQPFKLLNAKAPLAKIRNPNGRGYSTGGDWPSLLVRAGLLVASVLAFASARRGTALQGPRGLLKCGDLIGFRLQGEFQAGFAKAFFKVEEKYFALLSVLQRHEGATFLAGVQNVKECFVKASLLLGAFPFMKNGDNILVVASVDILVA
jgi:hypothetical protein